MISPLLSCCVRCNQRHQLLFFLREPNLKHTYLPCSTDLSVFSGPCFGAPGWMMQRGIMISPLIHYGLSQFVFWHGPLWPPRAPVCLRGCFYTWLSGAAIGVHPHVDVTYRQKSKKTRLRVHTWTGLLAWTEARVEVGESRSGCPSGRGLFPGSLCGMISLWKLDIKDWH